MVVEEAAAAEADALLTEVTETYIKIEAEEEGGYSWSKQEKVEEESVE
jgi:hypothetical protein